MLENIKNRKRWSVRYKIRHLGPLHSIRWRGTITGECLQRVLSVSSLIGADSTVSGRVNGWFGRRPLYVSPSIVRIGEKREFKKELAILALNSLGG
jgi:hypothetical protein